jgi:hypothetical protein
MMYRARFEDRSRHRPRSSSNGRRKSLKFAVMLARNGYITGQSIHVNGGVYPTS